MTDMMSRVVVMIAALACCAAPAPAQELPEVKAIVFPGANNWPIWAAEARGEFAKSGIRVALTPTPNSVFLMTGLIQGKFDVAIAAIDNLVAYQEGQGEVTVEGEIDLVAVMGANNGFNSLMASPKVKDVADFRGRKVAVDAATTSVRLWVMPPARKKRRRTRPTTRISSPSAQARAPAGDEVP